MTGPRIAAILNRAAELVLKADVLEEIRIVGLPTIIGLAALAEARESGLYPDNVTETDRLAIRAKVREHSQQARIYFAREVTPLNMSLPRDASEARIVLAFWLLGMSTDDDVAFIAARLKIAYPADDEQPGEGNDRG
ncbi:hypothetical protein [Herbidospora mongoliensis]|uniref:hypothetical protein n=1 Tax=Herbidospora mongoliensis TaxID=688067 RepID=UPI000831A34D|nr:hypothetical protein [Herbidospora mongoliensis]